MNRKNNLNAFGLGVLLVVALFVSLPVASYASTYAYVNTSGAISHVEASSPESALANAVNKAAHSGVMLVTVSSTVAPVAPVTQPVGNIVGYLYVNTFGQVVFVDVNSAQAAFSGAINIAPNSGVMIIKSTSDQNMVGDIVPGV